MQELDIEIDNMVKGVGEGWICSWWMIRAMIIFFFSYLWALKTKDHQFATFVVIGGSVMTTYRATSDDKVGKFDDLIISAGQNLDIHCIHVTN